jgi:hypothetical protein
MAMVVQSEAARQGNANTIFYTLATKQRAGGASVFHDITSGNNSVPGQTGFSAGVGYDQTTGLGSVDASVLVSHWNDATSSPAFRVTPSSSSVALKAGSNISITLTVAVSGGFNAPVVFSVTGLPSGVTSTFAPSTIAAPGSGTSTLRFNAASSVSAGTYSVTVTATSGGTKQVLPLSIVSSRATAAIR